MFVGSLGDLNFEVSNYKVLTFREFKREGGAKYATHEVIGQPPKLEFLHREPTKISLEIDLLADLGIEPGEEMQKIIEMCNEGVANYLIIGGEVFGDCEWVIEDFSETVKHYDGQGKVIAGKVSLKLQEYN